MIAQLVQEFGLGYTVVMGLMNRYLLSNHAVYTGNFLSSLPLATDLLQADTYFCGTLRSNRIGVPRELPNIRLNKYDNIKWVKDDIMVTKWKDKRDVYMLSTNNNGSDVEKQPTKFRREEIISIPSVITDYNARMGGVDHADQLRSYYDVGRTGRRWWTVWILSPDGALLPADDLGHKLLDGTLSIGTRSPLFLEVKPSPS